MFDAVEIKEVKQEIGLLVKRVRKKRKLTQVKLADRTELHVLTIKKLEAGSNFTIDTLMIVLKELDLLQDLYTEVKTKRKNIEETKSLY